MKAACRDENSLTSFFAPFMETDASYDGRENGVSNVGDCFWSEITRNSHGYQYRKLLGRRVGEYCILPELYFYRLPFLSAARLGFEA